MNILQRKVYITLMVLLLTPVYHAQANNELAEKYYQEGAQLLLWGKASEAEIKLLLARREAPNREDIAHKLTELYLIQSHLDKGLAIINEHLQIDASSPRSHLLKAQLLIKLNNKQQATQSLHTAANLAPNDQQNLADVASLFLNLGDTQMSDYYSRRETELSQSTLDN